MSVAESVEIGRRMEQKREFAPKRAKFGNSATEVGGKSVLGYAK
jgi:hypothetical protein